MFESKYLKCFLSTKLKNQDERMIEELRFLDDLVGYEGKLLNEKT